MSNYLKLSARNLVSQKGYTLINIFGLAVGIASALLIILYVIDELSYDKFHSNADNIYRICLDARVQDTEMRAPISNVVIGATAVEEYPDILDFTRLFTYGGEPDIRYGDKTFVEKNTLYADSSLFRIFDGFNLLRGDPYSILNEPNQMVMTRSTAFRYFGDDNPVGKMVQMWNGSQTWEVVGIVEDLPSNSHIEFDIVFSFVTLPSSKSTSWGDNNFYTYLLLQEGTDPEEVDTRLTDLAIIHAGKQFEESMGQPLEELISMGFRYNYFTQQLTDIHLRSDMPFEMKVGGSLTMVYALMLIALFILIIAAINFMNLSTARSAKRAKEAGIRKVAGSTRIKLIGQFLTESVIVSAISIIIAIGIVLAALEGFNNIAGKDITLTSLPLGISAGVLAAMIILVGFGAGSYPAFFFASTDPLKILKGRLQEGMKSSMLRGILVVFQFTITIGLLISTLVVFSQISFIRNKDLGFNPENLLVINRPYVIPNAQRESFDNELRNMPDVEAVSRSISLPTIIMGNTIMQKRGAAGDDVQSYNFFYASYDLDKTLQFRIAEGRYFDRDYASDSSAMVINQAAARGFGFEGSAIGQVVAINLTDERTIVGVIEDYHYESLHQQISPMVIAFGQHYSLLSIRLKKGGIQEAIRSIESKWNEFVPDQPLDYFFLEDAVENMYSDEKRAGILFSGFSILAIIIASMGLLGLSSYSAEQRTREIGIRKVYGASESRVVWLLLKEINILFIVSTVISWPIAGHLMSNWLENFAFRIPLSPGIFIGSSLLTYIIAVLTVGYQAVKAARTNPAITIKYE